MILRLQTRFFLLLFNLEIPRKNNLIPPTFEKSREKSFGFQRNKVLFSKDFPFFTTTNRHVRFNATNYKISLPEMG